MSDAYNMIDHFFRNNLDDDDYAEYSTALDELTTPVVIPPQPAPQGVAEVMQLVRDHASRCISGTWDDRFSASEEVKKAITAIIAERDALRARVAELEKDAERYQFWRNRWGDEQFLSTLAGTIRQLSDPLIRGDYNNLDIVSDAAIAAAKEPK